MSDSPQALPLKIWHAIPLKLVLLLVALSLVLKNPDGRAEYYPFSNYPMYSQFDERDYFVYLADQDGKALPSKETFRITTPKVKKRFKKVLGKVAKELGKKKREVDGADLEAVAVTTLKSLMNAVPDHPRVATLTELQLIYVDLRREGDEIVVEQRKVGAIAR
ncbi:MAG: hypothetical protein ACI8XO_000648 [Verrucomicrobiales bacterium]|jgi:hypothetical protein